MRPKKLWIVIILFLFLSLMANVYFINHGVFLTRCRPQLEDAETFLKLSGLQPNNIILVDLVKPVGFGTSGYIAMGGIVYEPEDELNRRLVEAGWEQAHELPNITVGNTFRSVADSSKGLYIKPQYDSYICLVILPSGSTSCIVFIACEYHID